ncbi:MAG: disulfide bond formation protein DsbA [Acidimicrobiales bacterium]
MTARWVVEEVVPARGVKVIWRPISLLLKNKPSTDSPFYGKLVKSHNMLRVMESVRASEGDAPIERLYWEMASRIHHDKEFDFPMEDVLVAAGVSTSHAAAFDDESWDAVVQKGHDAGLELVGQDVGTPIIAFDNAEGQRVGIFGPVITRVPNRQLSLQLWDGMMACMGVPGFWELKRTRTEAPDLGDRPEF